MIIENALPKIKNGSGLLMPRYEVIDKYPNSPFKSGDIIIYSKIDNAMAFRRIKGHNAGSIEASVITNPALYPNLFKRLHWYEKRNENEMPEYVLVKHTNKKWKVIQWNKYPLYLGVDLWSAILIHKKETGYRFSVQCDECIPITEEVFINL